MSELRQSRLSGDWVVIATERAKRPHSYAAEAKEADSRRRVADCPFCSGNEGMTPPETFAVRPAGGEPDTPGWQIRVVPNKFPAFNSEPIKRKAPDALHPIRAGYGRHEVIIHGPYHERSLGEMSLGEVVRIFEIYQERIRTAAAETEAESVIIIVNSGAEAGASIPHPHSQLFAVPIIPEAIGREMSRFRAFKEETGSCLLCDLADSEIAAGGRIVTENEGAAAFCNWASRVPFETCIVPKKCLADFASAGRADIEAVAEAVRSTFKRLRTGLGDVPYNMYLHTRPLRAGGPYHWHIVVLPKTSIIAGFEYASGIMINVVQPEAAADYLRKASAE